ncbi:MAG: aminotransferase class I/II-fold pyridoxal phosphate-dependent enzyme [Planctomycetota bacterium]|nr:aminotransferase class I/II-fold pyridoxal phosphate-dependent enzyme [Planctomycetota bacterium]
MNANVLDNRHRPLDLSLVNPKFFPRTHLVDSLRHWANVQPTSPAFWFTDGETDQDETLSYAELDHAARALAVEILKVANPGDRGILMYPPGLDFIIGFFGCLYAGCTAVPAFPPRRNRKGSRIQGIAQDCAAKFGLTIETTATQIMKDDATREDMSTMKLISSDRVDRSMAIQFSPVSIDVEDVAVLQYTSGSTGTPKGVVLTHECIMRNCEMIAFLFGQVHDEVGASWLPTYHDMGLVGGILSPVFLGLPLALMSPMSFLQRPVRWLRAITKYNVTMSGGPNFAYQLCVDKVTEEEMKGLDLSKWRVAFNGAEPVRASTLEAFSRKFEQVGFRHTSHLPTYGMAETTLIVTAGPHADMPVIRHYDGRHLAARVVLPVERNTPDSRALVGCGQMSPNERVEIVDTETSAILPDDQIGEIWIQSPSAGTGYWEKPDITEKTFNAMTADGQGPFLRTGDLGFFEDGQLFVAGRVKDLIIVRGVNRYPQDIEQTVEECHESIQSSAAAAFSDDIDGRERLIIALEVQRSLEEDWEPVIQAIRKSVTQVHELPPDAVILVRSGSLPKTSSGKIQRHACLQGFKDDTLRVIAKWVSWEDDLPPTAPMIAAATVDQLAGRPSKGSARPTAVIAKKTRDPDVDVVEIVKRAVKAVAQERAKLLDLDTNIVVDLGLDSLERLQIAHSLENAFGGRIPEETLQEIETIREIAEALESLFGKDRVISDLAPEQDDAPKAPRTITPDEYQFDQLPEYRRLKQTMMQFDMTGVPNPYFSVHQGLTRDTTTIDGKEYISFASYNYLGMSGDPEVSQAVIDAVAKYGTSVSASRLVSGEKDLHRELEKGIAEWIGVDDSIVLVGGHSTNETIIGHIVDSPDLILHDSLSHNSIVQGAMLSGARRRPFAHNDWEALDEALTEQRSNYRRVLVIIEGVYSMDGDYPNLPKFIEIVKKHQCWLMVDEAHSIGTMGATGRGIGEHFGVDPHDVDIWMGTLSKSFGSCGGYIAGRKSLIEYLKYTTPGFVFSVGLSPPNTAAAIASLNVLKQNPERVTRLKEASRLFLTEAKKHGLNTGSSGDTAVVPVITGNSLHALQLSRRMFESGVNVQPILYPAVEESATRLRFFINSTHTNQQILFAVDKVAQHLKKIAPEYFKSTNKKD